MKRVVLLLALLLTGCGPSRIEIPLRGARGARKSWRDQPVSVRGYLVMEKGFLLLAERPGEGSKMGGVEWSLVETLPLNFEKTGAAAEFFAKWKNQRVEVRGIYRGQDWSGIPPGYVEVEDIRKTRPR